MGRFWGLHAEPGKTYTRLLGILPFLVVIALYLTASHFRQIENPADKLLPGIEKLSSAVERVAFQEDKRTGKYLLWADTGASLRRIGLGMLAAATCGLLLGINLGAFPGFGALFQPVVTFIAIIPPLAILPILFLAFGVGEFAKIFLIFIGTAPIITRDIMFAVQKLPNEQLVKALTLGASELRYVYRIIMPQILPRLIETVRLSLGAAWLFLIASEAIAADQGLGYRIFLVRRYLAMDVILPYAIWITLLGFALDIGLRAVNRFFFPWYDPEKEV